MDTSLHNFIQEITNDCKNRNIKASEEFVAFLVSLESLTSTYQVDNDKDKMINEKKIHAAVIEKMLDQSGPILLTLKTQFYFVKHYRDRDNIIKKYRDRLTYKTAPLIKEICEINKLDNAKEMEVLYQKILVVITLVSGLGNPTLPAVLREVAITLQSVLQPSELPRFITLSKPVKEEQLMELVFIVAGIRLFNRDCQRGGNDIDDLPSILQAGVNRTHSSIIQLLEMLMEKVYKFTAAIEAVIYNSVDFENNLKFKDILWSIEMLLASRQLEIYVRKLRADLQLCDEEIRGLVCGFKNRLIQVHDTVKYRTAIPTSQIYPQFKDLAGIWLKLQDEVITLSYIDEILWKLQCFLPKIIYTHHHNVLNKLLNKVEIVTDAERLKKSMGKLIVDCGNCSLAYPSNNSNFDQINLQFLGFCIWSFVVGNGALIPGNPNIGVAEWKGKYFAFCSIEAARCFGEYPDRFLQTALNIVKMHHEYIHFFQLFKNIQMMNREERLSGVYVPFKFSQNQEVQTDTHIFATSIDINYSSSLWVHRRRALQFATICQCMTRSTQTIKSHFKTDIYLQTLMSKEKEVQTKKDSGTNPQKLNKYIFGLRSKKNVQFINYALSK